LDEAEKQARRVLGKRLPRGNPHYVFALLHFLCGDAVKALEEVELSIKADPTFAPVFLLKNQAIVMMPKPDDPNRSADENRNNRRQLMEDALQSLKTYLLLMPGERSNPFLLGQLEAIGANIDALSNISPSAEIVQPKEVTTRARVLTKPEPNYTEEARSAHIIGTVVLRAVFSAEGKVEHILVIKPLPFGLSERAVIVAKQIQFVPARKDGKPVSMWMQLEYNFNLY
jgi:TonB family protein